MSHITDGIRWGATIGIANLLWLYSSYYLGLHTRGILVLQFVALGWFMITVAGFVLALRSIGKRRDYWTYWDGLSTGALIAIVTACIAIVAQVGYYALIHPAWPDLMVQQTREHFSAQGIPAQHVEQMADQARRTFALRNYATQSALTTLITGLVLSSIIMMFLRRNSYAAHEG